MWHAKAGEGEWIMENQKQEILSKILECMPTACVWFAMNADEVLARTGLTQAELQAPFADNTPQSINEITIRYEAPLGGRAARLHFNKVEHPPLRRWNSQAPAAQPSVAPENASAFGFDVVERAAFDPIEIGKAAKELQKQRRETAGKRGQLTATEAVNAVLKARGLPVGA
jgi:hypothetical protein